MSLSPRASAAIRAAFFHFLGSLVLACLAATLVFLVWYPHPYILLSGGLKLFLILVSVDVVCGPLLTLVLYNPAKSRRELILDLGLVTLIQIAALAFGMHTVYDARPLFLVQEVDRFRVIALPDYGDADVRDALSALTLPLRPHWFKGPVVVGIRNPKDGEERNNVLLESAFGGRDYSQRPDFYQPYDEAYASTALQRARPLQTFIERYPEVASAASALLQAHELSVSKALYLPVLHKQDWVAVLEPSSARILGFLPGDGF